MIKKILCQFVILSLLFINVACQNLFIDGQGKQYKAVRKAPLSLDKIPAIKLANITEYRQQIALIKTTNSQLYKKNAHIYQAIDKWLSCLEVKCQSDSASLLGHQVSGADNKGNVHLTGYYTPVIKARPMPNSIFRYPFYRFPKNWSGKLPSRGEIYSGALNNRKLEIAYTSSLIDNFIMQVQGSGYVDFEDNNPLHYFVFGGKNGYRYQSIGRLLVEQDKIAKQDMSIREIKKWAEKTNETAVVNFLKQNDSFVFFSPKPFMPVVGAAGVPLVDKTAVASDRSLIPTGAVLFVDMPLLDKRGKFIGQREWRLMVALDIGSAVQGHHLDIYQGIGEDAGDTAGYYHHYGYVWQLLVPSRKL